MNREHAPSDGFLLPVQKCREGQDVASLADHELIAAVIGTGTRGKDVMELSLQLLRDFGGLHGILSRGIREIARARGMGLAKAIRVRAAFELGRRVISRKVDSRCVDSPAAVWEFLLPYMAGLEREEFRVLVLNNKNGILKNSMVSAGTVSEALVHPREVFRDAIREGAVSLIVAHNHPTGELTPSKEDISTTRRLVEAGAIIGIPILDHVIITDTSYYSFKEGGYI